MAILSGGRYERIARPADAITRLRQVDLADLKELRVLNNTNGSPARALRIFPDGSFDAFVELDPGRNLLVFTAIARNGSMASVAREVTRPRDGANSFP